MTADDFEEKKNDQGAANKTHSSLPQEILDIFDYLSLNTKIVFKSQQRDEPELQTDEKVKLAKDIYQRNIQTFLMRFGCYLEEKHLKDFARICIADSDEELHSLVKDYQSKLKTRQQDVKNRRYAALQKLIKEGEYFSEQEMMKRSPDLYQELVGQYLSKEEKLQRDSYDVKNTTFSGILMHRMVQDEITEILEKAENQTDNLSGDNAQESSSVKALEDNGTHEDSACDDDIVPIDCRQQWGNFDNEQIACSSTVRRSKMPEKLKGRKTETPLITADERELLRQEFISQMHAQFLSGQDEFDYSTVDDNTQFDDLQILNQDKEDKYFEESDNEESNGGSKCKDSHEMDDESEDELDLYMSHLNKHHSLQKY